MVGGRYSRNMLQWIRQGTRKYTADILTDWVGKYRHFLETEKGVSREMSLGLSEAFVADFLDFLHRMGLRESPEGIWVFRNILNKAIRWPEDAEKIVELIQDFNEIKKSSKFSGERDLLRYSGFQELWRMVDAYFNKGNGSEGAMDLPGVKYLGSYKNLQLYEVIDPVSMSVIAKRGSGWCVKNVTYAHEYLKRGPFLLVMKSGKNYVLLHEGSSQAKDLSDNTLKPEIAEEIFPLVKDFLPVRLKGEFHIFLNALPYEEQKMYVSSDPKSIAYIKDPPEELQVLAVESNPACILYIDNPSENVQRISVEGADNNLRYVTSTNVQLEAVRRNPDAIRYLKVQPEIVQLEALKASKGKAIRYITSPTKAAILLAVELDGDNIRYVPQPTLEVQLAAVRSNPDSIALIERPGTAVINEAVSSSSLAYFLIEKPMGKAVEIFDAHPPSGAQIDRWIKSKPRYELALTTKQPGVDLGLAFILTPDKYAQELVIRVDPRYIAFIKYPMRDIQLAAVMDDIENIRYIKYPCEEAALVVVRKNPLWIKEIQSPSRAVARAAIEQDGSLIRYLTYQPVDLQMEAVKQDPENIRYIKYPDEDVQLLAIEMDPTVIQYIRKPSESIMDRIRPIASILSGSNWQVESHGTTPCSNSTVATRVTGD